MPLACTRHPHFHQPLASHPRSSQRSQDGRRKKRRDPKTHGTGWFVHSGLTFSPIETRRGGSRDHVTNWAAPTARTDSLLKSGRCQRTCVRSSAACTIYRANKGEQKLTIREEKRKEKKRKEKRERERGKKKKKNWKACPGRNKSASMHRLHLGLREFLTAKWRGVALQTLLNMSCWHFRNDVHSAASSKDRKAACVQYMTRSTSP